MKKGMTLIEVMVVVAIGLIFLSGAIGVVGHMSHSKSGDSNSETDFDFSYLNPQFETARQQRKIAEELKRQNDLMERRMNNTVYPDSKEPIK